MPPYRSPPSSASFLSPSGLPSSSPTLLLPLNATRNRAWLAPWTRAGTTTLTGYQIWAVEQRVTDRDAVLPVIVVLTGDKKDSITLDRFTLAGGSVPESTSSNFQRTQSKRWDETISILKSSGARISDTSDGFLPVTSLPSLPPTMSIVQIPDGDYEKHVAQLYLQINLRRIGLGGRKSLSLSDATSAQQLHFRQAFHLPIAAPAVQSTTMSPRGVPTPPPPQFAECVLDLIRLVQHALALFGLGVVRIPPTSDAASASAWHGASEVESTVRLDEGDGLLCDQTVDALALFRVDIGEPLLRFNLDDSTLPPPLLAGLLSLVISARGKLISLGCNGVPKDPFARRQKFLFACETFQKTHRLHPPSPYLTRPLLSAITALWAKTRHGDSARASKTLGRVIRTRLDQLDPLHAAARHGEEVETANLEELVRFIGGGVGGSTVGRVWGVKGAKVHKPKHSDKERERDTEMTEALQTDRDDAADKSGPERSGLRARVVRGVRETAGRASRRLGDNLGFSESLTSPVSGAPPSLAPALVLSEASSNESSTRRPSISRATSQKSTLGSRLSAALGSDRDQFDSGTFSRRRSTPNRASSLSVGIGHPPARTKSISRRAASEAQGLAVPGWRTPNEAFGFEEGEETPTGNPVLHHHRRRRHSIATMRDPPEPFQWLSRKRLEMDVNLRMTAWTLRQRERRLSEMVGALSVVHAAYGQAIESLQTPLETRSAQCEALEATATSLMYHVDSYATPTSPIAHLATGSSRLLYAQRVLEDKLSESVLEFAKLVRAKVGPGGTLDLGTRALGRERSGVRRFVATLSQWGDWVGVLSTRLQWHLRRWGRTGAAKDE